MNGPVFEALADGVVRTTRTVEGARWSPDGAMVAWWHPRTATEDLRARERVYCVEVASGRVVCALDGPDVVRALGWLDRETLLVQRDWEGAAILTAHAMPDGGVVAEALLPGAEGWPADLTVSADGATVLSSPRYGLSPMARAIGYTLRAPELTVLRAIAPPALRRKMARSTPMPMALSPDGRRVVVPFVPETWSREAEVVWVRADRADEGDNAGVWSLGTMLFHVRWLRPGEVLLSNGLPFMFVRLPEPDEGAEYPLPASMVPRSPVGVSGWTWDVSPDASCLVGAVQRSTPERIERRWLCEAGAVASAKPLLLPVAALAFHGDAGALVVLSAVDDLILSRVDAGLSRATAVWRGTAFETRRASYASWSLARVAGAIVATGLAPDGERLYRFDPALLDDGP